jgi:hypothetical protein
MSRLPLTPRVNNILLAANKLSHSLGVEYVGVEHLLPALAAELAANPDCRYDFVVVSSHRPPDHGWAGGEAKNVSSA